MATTSARTAQRGFTLLEMMVAVAVVGTLAAVAVPSFMGSVKAAKVADVETELEKAASAARLQFRLAGAFPSGAAAVLPGPVGSACDLEDKRFPVNGGWKNDAVWRALDFSVDYATPYSYKYERIDDNTIQITAAADLACDGNLTTHTVTVVGIDDGHAAELAEEDSVASANAVAAAANDSSGPGNSGNSGNANSNAAAAAAAQNSNGTPASSSSGSAASNAGGSSNTTAPTTPNANSGSATPSDSHTTASTNNGNGGSNGNNGNGGSNGNSGSNNGQGNGLGVSISIDISSGSVTVHGGKK